MKKIVRLFAFAIAVSSIMVVQSCKEDDPLVVPTLTPPTGVVAVQVGAKVDVTFSFTAGEGFKSASPTATGGTVTVKTPPASGATEGSIVLEFTADNTAGAGSVALVLTDDKDQTVSQTAVVNKSISAPPTLVLSAATGSANPGSTVTVTATVTAANGAKSINYTTTGGLTGSPASPVTLTGTSQVLTFTVPAAAAIGSTMTVAITAVDNQGLSSSPVTFTVMAATNSLTGTMAADMTLKKGSPYLITSTFIVPSGKTLTVEAGAIIKGDKATKGILIIKQGGILIANGTVADPIIFTSSQPAGERDRGDWGGIVLMGDAFVNQTAKPSVEGLSAPSTDADFYKYGTVSTSNATVGINDQNSGSLKYARIEYAGIELIPNSETNSLTMAGVGSGTTIDYVQSSYGGDDGFEWFGGTVSAKHLVSLATWDDDFDTDFGWRGNVQWGVVVRAPFVADQSGSTSFESDSQGNANAIGTICTDTDRSGCTQGVFSNITVLGPRDFTTGFGGDNNTNARAISGNYTRAMHIRRRTAISVFNSVISGWGSGTTGVTGAYIPSVTIDDAGTVANYEGGFGVLSNNVLLHAGTPTNSEFGTNVTIGSPAAADLARINAVWNAAGSLNTTTKPTTQASPAFSDALTVTTTTWGIPGTKVRKTIAGVVEQVDVIQIASPYEAFGIERALFYGSSSSATLPATPNFATGAGSLATGALFTNAKLGTFFDKTITYKGAFGTTDWTDTWTEWVPITKAY